MIEQEKYQNEAQQIIQNALTSAALTVATLTVVAVTGVLLAFLAEVGAATAAPHLVKYLSKEIPGFIPGSSNLIKFKPALEKAIKPVAEEIIRRIAS
jgi:hypothetical protein